MVADVIESRQIEKLRNLIESQSYYEPEYPWRKPRKPESSLDAVELMYAYYGTR